MDNEQELIIYFGTSIPNISIHTSNIFRDNELDKDSVVKDYLTTAADGKPYYVAELLRKRGPRGRGLWYVEIEKKQLSFRKN